MNWSLLLNSLVVSGLTTLLAVGLGSAVALFACGLIPRRRRWLIGAAALALALPPFLATDCWLYLLGHTGIWRSWLPVSIYSLGGAVWVLASLLWPVPMFALLGAWHRLEASHWESDPALTGVSFIRWLLLPAARAALGQAAALTFVLALNNFTVPAVLQVKVFPAELWVRFSTDLDYLGALGLSWPLVLGPLLLLVWLGRREVAWPRLEASFDALKFRRQLGGGWFWAAGLGSLIVCGLTVAIPLGRLLAALTTWPEVVSALAAGQTAVVTSFLLAVVTATLTVGLGLIGWRLPLGLLLWAVFLVPGVLLRIGLIWVLNRPILALIYQSAGVLVIGTVLRYLAIGWNGAALARRSVDRELTEAALLDGASSWQLFCHVHWPQMAPRLALAWYATYLLCLWDVETLVLLVPPGGETLALRIFSLLHYGHNSQVSALCVLLLFVAVLPALLWLCLAVLPPLLWRSGRELRRWLTTALVAGAVAGCSPGAGSRAPWQSELFRGVEVIGSRGVGAGQFNKPRSVALDADDNLYVVDMTGRVQKFSAQGVWLSAWQMPQTSLGKAKGMCRDLANRIVVVEPHYSRVNHFSPAGQLQLQWGVRGTNAGQLSLPRAVAADSHGNLFVSEYSLAERVQRFSPDGSKLLAGFGRFGSGPGEFNRVEGLGLDSQDRLYVADSCNHRIQVLSPEGRWLRSYGRAGRGPGELSYPYDVRVDAAGYQFVCEFGNSRIQVFDSQDQPVEILGGAGAEQGQFNNPWAIALDSAGNLYVADSGNHRVQKLLRRKPLKPVRSA